jgi:carbon starvation protein
MGKVIHPKLGEADWWPGAILSTALIVLGWAYFINANSMAMIWPMFGIANQMLAVIALAVITCYLANEGRARYLAVTVLPMLWVATTTFTAGAEMLANQFKALSTQLQNAPGARNGAAILHASVLASLILLMLVCGSVVLLAATSRVWAVTAKPARRGLVGLAAE